MLPGVQLFHGGKGRKMFGVHVYVEVPHRELVKMLRNIIIGHKPIDLSFELSGVPMLY